MSILFLLPTAIIGIICVILIVIQTKKRPTSEYEPLLQENGTRLSYDSVSKETNNSILNVHPYDSTNNHTSITTETCIDHSGEPTTLSQNERSFGQIPSAGTWKRDLAGKSLTKFIVLILFLLFSCVVVSFSYYIYYWSFSLPNTHIGYAYCTVAVK